MLIDTAEITVRGGHGGAGMPKKPKGPDGGNGGNGGDVYIRSSSNLNLLNQFSQKDLFIAGNGRMGARNNKTGKDGKDIEVLLPIGTSIYDKKTNEFILEINNIGERILFCKGGRGGLGGLNAKQGLRGEEKKLILSLRLIADFGLIGLPNAGKSSLLNELTNAQAKIANYPFTTLEPNLGVCESKFLADIPGLIEGASQGKGLGIRFLKHIEKISVILHCISSESSDLIKDYNTVRSEIDKYSPELLKKTEVILLTKSDLIDKKIIEKDIKKLKTKSKKILAVSVYDWGSLKKLKKLITN